MELTKEFIEKTLMSTNREGMDKLLEYMEENGFYKSPCSGSHHLAVPGGLAEHSLNVWYTIAKFKSVLCDTFQNDIGIDSYKIVSLLHDLGKMGDFGKPNYVTNILKSGKQSDSKPFATNKELLYVPHEIRSVKIATRFIELTEMEEQAILYHNGLYGDFRYEIQNNETPLYMMLHWADMWCSRVIEEEEEDE